MLQSTFNLRIASNPGTCEHFLKGRALSWSSVCAFKFVLKFK